MVKKTLVWSMLLVGFLTVPRPVLAGCGDDLVDCYIRAAQIDNFWYRTAAALNCEMDFAACARLLLVGD